MSNYTITGYKVFEAPKPPTEKGKYVSQTPILEQALEAVTKAKQQGKLYFIKAICSDGVERYYE